MKRKFFTIMWLLVLALFASASSTAGQEGPEETAAAPQAPVAVEGTVTSSISYQGILRESGTLVTGTRNMTFRFFDNSSCSGTNIYAIYKPNVSVTNGLFSAAVDVNPSFFDGRGLWLRVDVGSIGIGCQALLPAPYALSLRPGAIVSGAGTTLSLASTTGNALQATTSTTAGGTVAAISAKSTATSGGKAAIDGEIASRSDWTVGVWGRATGTSGITSGVWGQTESTTDGARGVTGWAHGTSGITYGVRGDSQSPAGTGVAGYANAASGATIGVRGESGSPTGTGVLGVAGNGNGGTNGVMGVTWSSTDGARGVTGWAPAGSGATIGVFGDNYSSQGVGVAGTASSGSGVIHGVWGQTDSNTFGTTGITGYASATSGETHGVEGISNSPGGWAGAFYNPNGYGVWIDSASGKSGLTVYHGSKNAAVDTQDGSRLLYSEESTGVWFTDYGFGKLAGGAAQIAIDPTFAQTVNLAEPYHVFVQVYDDADVYVTNRTATGFEVRLREGDPNAEFSYRIVARRLGYEGQRLERAPSANRVPLLPPERQTVEPSLGLGVTPATP